MKNVSKRLLSFVLSVLMLAGTVNLAVFAEAPYADRIESIVLEPIDNVYYEETHLQHISYWDYSIEDYVEYDEYILPEASVIVNFKDGSFERFDSIYDLYYSTYDSEAYPEISSDQTVDNIWGSGTHYFTVEIYGRALQLPVIIEEAPFEYFTVNYEKNELIEGVSGWDSYYYDENSNYIETYYYDAPSFTVDLHMKDGTVAHYDYLYYLYNEYGVDPTVYSDQTDENQWGVGSHEFTVKFLGKTAPIYVNIVENPIDHFTVEAKNPDIIENTNGYENTNWDYDGNEISYYRYYTPEYSLTVYYKDGTVRTFENRYELQNEYVVNINVDTDQSYYNPWGLGTHEFTVSFAGKTAPLSVNIIENPIDHFTVEAKNPDITEYSKGQMYTEWDGDGNPHEYYVYDMPDYSVTLYFKDGASQYIDSQYDIYDLYDVDVNTSSDQSYENQWGVGTHEFTVEYMGMTAPIYVNIVENPVDHFTIEAKNPDIIENTNGYEDTDWDYYGNEISYFRYYNPNYTVTVYNNDGTVRTFENEYELQNEYNEYISIISDQSYDNPWELGTHEFTARFMGMTAPLYVNIVENPFDHFTVEAKNPDITENTIGWVNSSWDSDGNEIWYFVYSIPDFSVTVYRKDGTTEYYDSTYEFESVYGDSLYINSDQSGSNPWGVGEHSFNARFMGLTAELSVNIVQSPVEHFTVTPTEPVIYENTRGYIETCWDSDGNEHKYFVYRCPSLTFTLYYRDGTSKTFEYEYELYELFNRYPDSHSDQSFDNQWGIGEHEFTVEFLGMTASVPVSIVENPFDHFTVNAKEPDILENTRGYIDTYWDSDGNEHKYYVYGYPEVSVTVYKKDGTSEYYNDRYELESAYGESIRIDSDQSLSNQWGVGEHSFTAYFMGMTADLTVNIVQSPVDHFTVELLDNELEAYLDGNYGTYYNMGGETGHYFRYYDPRYEITVYMTDGEVIKSNSIYDIESIYGLECSISSDQGSDNVWGPGKHTYTFNIQGKTEDVEVNVVPSRVESIEILDMFFAGGFDRVAGSVEINYTDGTSATEYLEGISYDNINYPFGGHVALISIEDDTVTMDFGGARDTYTVTISEEDCFNYYWTEDEVIITGYFGKVPEDGALVIPSEINGLPVTAISGLRCEGVTDLTVPDSVRSIEENAFLYTDIKTLRLGDGLIMLDNKMLDNIENLENVYIDCSFCKDVDGIVYTPDLSAVYYYPSARSGVYKLPESVTDLMCLPAHVEVDFSENKNFIKKDGVVYSSDMTTVISCDKDLAGTYIMPDSVKNIRPYAFANCDSLKDVKVSDKVTDIAYYAFNGCSSLASVDLPAGLLHIRSGAFGDCDSLSKVNLHDIASWCSMDFEYDEVYGYNNPLNTAKNLWLDGKQVSKLVIPEGVESIVEIAFMNVENITSVSFPKTLREIDPKAFYKCTGIKSLDIPGNVRRIGNSAFERCYGVSSLTLNEGIERIEYCAFSDLDKLTQVMLPESVKSFGSSIFSGCDALKGITVKSIKALCNAEYEGSAFSGYELILDSKVITDLVIPEGITSIPDNIFSYTLIKTVAFPKSIKSIGEFAFKSCRNLTGYSFAKGAKNVFFGYGVFKGSSKLENVPFGEDTPSVSEYMLSGTGIKELSIPTTVTAIAYGAFSSCSSLEKVTAPKGHLVSIGGYSFYDTPWYDKMPEGCVYIGDNLYTYKGRTGETVKLESDTVSISELAFYDQNLRCIDLPEGLKAIGRCAFTQNPLESLNLPASLESFRGDSVKECYRLTEINVSPDNKTYASLDGILYSKDMTELIRCPEGKSGRITIPESVKLIRADAFDGVMNVEIVFENAYTKLEPYAMGYYSKPFKNQHEGYYYGTVICSAKGTKAEKYANDNNIIFRETDLEFDGPENTYGDLNGDDRVTTTDAILLLRYIANWSVSVNVEAADVNGDGKVNTTDVILTLRFIANWNITLG